jgi:hypothetical protein
LQRLVLQCLEICAKHVQQEDSVKSNQSEDRRLSEREYKAIQDAIAKIVDASQNLNNGVKALEKAFDNCCIHWEGSGRPEPHKRAS